MNVPSVAERGSVEERVDQLLPHADSESNLFAKAFGMIQVIGEIGDMPGSVRVRLARNVLTAAERVRMGDDPAGDSHPTAAGLVGGGLTLAPIAQHYETDARQGSTPGNCAVDCACGVTFGGFYTMAEALQALKGHIEAERTATVETDDINDDPGACAECGSAVKVVDNHLVHVNEVGGRLLLESHEAWVEA